MLHSSTVLVAAFCSLCSFPITTWAYFFGAGACDSGRPAVGPPHLVNGGVASTVTNGTLDQGSISVLLDGTILTPGTPASFSVGKNHTLTLKRLLGYKGLLFRLGGSVGTTALQLGDANLQVCTYCTDMSAGGITHTESSVKMQSQMILHVATEATSLPLDVTVVVRNNGISEFYYSAFTLNAESVTISNAPIAPTAAPPVSTVTASTNPTSTPSAVAPNMPSVAPAFKPSPVTATSPTASLAVLTPSPSKDPNFPFPVIPTLYATLAPTLASQITFMPTLPTTGLAPVVATLAPVYVPPPVFPISGESEDEGEYENDEDRRRRRR